MAQNSILGNIYQSAGMSDYASGAGSERPVDYTGITRPRYSSGASLMTPVQPDTWTPLNPGLARRYYDMFHRSWVVRSCFQEKIKAGFSGGFGYRYGPRKESAGRKARGKENGKSPSSRSPFSGKTSSSSSLPGDVVTDGPDIAWIEETLVKGVMYHDILGIVAFRRKVHPRTNTVRLEVIDIPKGYFVGKIDERGNQEYGWVFNKTVDTIAVGGRRPLPSEFSSSSAQHEPDPEVFVYAWPTLEPDIGGAAPFKSVMSTIFLNLLETAEMWQNEIEGHYKITHPTWITEPEITTRGPADTIEQDLLLSVTGQLGPMESMEYYERSRLNAEMSIHMSSNIEKMNDRNSMGTQRRLGLKLDNTEAVHTRLHSWQDNHYICPVGTKVGKGPEAKLRSDLVNIANLKDTQIAAVFGVPIPFLSSGKGASGGSKTNVGSRMEGATFRTTLVEMRRRITVFFEEAYMVAIGSLENSMLAKMVTDLGSGGSDTENMVRMYVRDIITPGGFLVLDEATTGYEPPIGDAEDGSAEKFVASKKRKGSSQGRKEIQDYEEGEHIEAGERKMGADMEAEDIRKKMEQRKLFTTPDAVTRSNRVDYAGDVILPDPVAPQGGPFTRRTNMAKKKVLGKHARSRGSKDGRVAEYIESTRVIDRKERDSDGNDPIQMHLEQWKGPYLRGQDVTLFERYEREKQDFIDEQKYLDKLEEARWQKFMEKSNLMDRRVSRIMVMALQNFGVALNPTKIQMALKREMRANPKLDNADHRTLSEDPLKRMEDVFVNEIISNRKEYLNDLVDETNRITIVWSSAPLPDIELLISASKEGLGIPAEMVGVIIASELGLEELREQYVRKEEMEDKKIETYLKRKNLKVSSKTTGEEKNGAVKKNGAGEGSTKNGSSTDTKNKSSDSATAKPAKRAKTSEKHEEGKEKHDEGKEKHDKGKDKEK